MATSKVVLNEKEILLLLRDFLEENGQYECLIAFEQSTGLYPPSLSAELVSLREVILWGNLDELQKRIFEPLQNMGEESELRKCKYMIAKQRYLETLLEVNSDKADLLKQQLTEVEELCPSPEEFKVLFSLLTLPSLSSSPEYKHWTIQKGRLQCFHQLASWLSKVLGMRAHLIPPTSDSSHPPEQRLPKTRLVQLLAKGLLYEQCEAICAHPTTNTSSGEATERGSNDDSTKLLDLYNWIKHQPDSAFQLSPSALQLQVRSKSGAASAKSRDDSFRGSSSESELSRSPRAAMGESSRPLLMEESQSTDQQNFVSDDGQTPSTEPAKDNKDMAHRQIEETEIEAVQSKSAAQDDRESQLAKETKNLHPESNMSENLTSKEAVSAGPQVGVHLAKLTSNMMQFDDNFADKNGGRVDDSSPPMIDSGKQADGTHSREDARRPSLVEKLKSEAEIAEHIMKEAALPISTSAPLLPAILLKQTMKFGDNFTDDSGAVKPTPPPPPPRHAKKKSGRKSSTPKPSSSRGLTQQISPPSPSTSPVPCVPSALASGSSSSSAKEEHLAMPTCKAKKHIDFSAENLEESIVFPTAKLLAHVKDKQVVRSVAFSKSGSVVAIGANSRTLRLCYTEPLLQENTNATVDEELPVFYSEQHYHKGSIYCMSWWGDTLLASGSNDQSIRLLSYDPTSQSSETACVSLGQMKIHRGTIRDLVFTLDGLLVSGGVGDNIIKIMNPSTAQVVNTLYGHFDQILGLYVVRENVIASASQDKSVKLWDLRIGQAHATIKLPQSVTSIATNTYSNQIASALLDGACAVHDLNTLKPISTYNAHSDECRTVRYSSSSEPSPWLLTGSYDGTICVADTKTFEWQQIAQHRDKVVQCRWHGTQSSLFASTGADNRACFWRLAV